MNTAPLNSVSYAVHKRPVEAEVLYSSHTCVWNRPSTSWLADLQTGALLVAAGTARTFGVILFCSAAMAACAGWHTYLVKSLEFPTEAPELTTHLFFCALLENQREIIFQDDTLSLHPHHAYYCIQERSKLAKLPSELAAHCRFSTVLE